MAFENFERKGENVSKQHFLLLYIDFYPFKDKFYHIIPFPHNDTF